MGCSGRSEQHPAAKTPAFASRLLPLWRVVWQKQPCRLPSVCSRGLQTRYNIPVMNAVAIFVPARKYTHADQSVPLYTLFLTCRGYSRQRSARSHSLCASHLNMLLPFDVCCGAPARAINPTIRLTETPKSYFHVVQVTGQNGTSKPESCGSPCCCWCL